MIVNHKHTGDTCRLRTYGARQRGHHPPELRHDMLVPDYSR